jgi:hypothetical protein
MVMAAWGDFNPLAIVKGYQAGEKWAIDLQQSEKDLLKADKLLKAQDIANEFNQNRIGSQAIADAIENKRLEALGIDNKMGEGKYAAQMQAWAEQGKARDRQVISDAVPRFEADGITPRDQRVVAFDISRALANGGHAAQGYDFGQLEMKRQLAQAAQAGNVTAAENLSEKINPYVTGVTPPANLTDAQKVNWYATGALPVLSGIDAGRSEAAKDGREFAQKYSMEMIKKDAIPTAVTKAAIEAGQTAAAEAKAANMSPAQQETAWEAAHNQVIRLATRQAGATGAAINTAIDPNKMGGGATVPSVLRPSLVTSGVNPSNMGGGQPTTLAAAMNPPQAAQAQPVSAQVAQVLQPVDSWIKPEHQQIAKMIQESKVELVKAAQSGRTQNQIEAAQNVQALTNRLDAMLSEMQPGLASNIKARLGL